VYTYFQKYINLYSSIYTSVTEPKDLYTLSLSMYTSVTKRNMMQKNFQKLVADIPAEEMKVIDQACELDRRTRASFIRSSCLEKAKKILEENYGNTPKLSQ